MNSHDSVGSMGKSLSSLLWLVVFASLCTPNLSKGDNAFDLILAGHQLTDEAAKRIEALLESNPKDIDSRTMLIGYYLSHQFDNEEKHKCREKHILWMITHAPDSAVLSTPDGTLNPSFDAEFYATAKSEWQRHIDSEPNNLKYLENAANFFFVFDPVQSEVYLLKAQSIDIKAPYWAEKLGQLYLLRAEHCGGQEHARAASSSLEQFEKAFELTPVEHRRHLLSYLAKMALESGDDEKAMRFASDMLEESEAKWNVGNDIHHGNLVMGRIALRKGNVEEAKRRLIAAGKTTGSPQLNSSGPGMRLANQLLLLGESEVVLDYFNLCDKFWSSSNNKLQVWRADIEHGRLPDFGTRLHY